METSKFVNLAGITKKGDWLRVQFSYGTLSSSQQALANSNKDMQGMLEKHLA